jgi:hypothetical protein
MELRRKQEEAERLRLEEEDRKAALMLQAQLEKEAQEDSKFRQQMEQERRDHELALRLAQESNGQLDESPTMSRKFVLIHLVDTPHTHSHYVQLLLKLFSIKSRESRIQFPKSF